MLKLKEVTYSLTTQMTEKTNVSEVIDTMKELVKNAKLADVEVVGNSIGAGLEIQRSYSLGIRF
ncbi:hypothetical protein C1H46_016506 [Malus baccata]|uniref:Uncharacterized protein n=1 Tax=Malus baccata TaxID=106549 RepID=A0A540MH05_MALBA|nr:hypothetical protein C1H46_016506 [Malus baccata]